MKAQTNQRSNMSKLHITTGSGKMEGIHSINTPATENPFCQAMAKTESICKSCFAMRYEGMRKNLIPAFRKNAVQLVEKDFDAPQVPYKVMRLHSFGELINYTHYLNFLKIAFANPTTQFTLWSKRKPFIQKYRREGGVVPSNLIHIFSNKDVDKEMTVVPKGFDKVFNVHTAKHVKETGIEINCGSKDCLGCMLCYSKNDVKIINEKKK